jgi:lipopolysaccharide biosynthesis glycosyltransferase
MRNICLTIDKNVLMPTVVMLESLFQNSGTDFHLHIVVDNSQYIGFKWLSKFIIENDARCTIYEPNHTIIEKYSNPDGHYSFATYYILFLASVLPTWIDEILYLDVDLLILGSLDPLFEIDIQKYDLAAVEYESSIAFKNNLGLNANDIYINTGVVLVNLVKWREKNYEDQFFLFYQNNFIRLTFYDQCIINGVCRDILLLDKVYNTRMDRTNFNVIKNIREVRIGHALGQNKPWNNQNHPIKNEYFKYFRLNFKGNKFKIFVLYSLKNCYDHGKSKLRRRLIREILFLFGYPIFPEYAISKFYNFTKKY